MFSVIAGGLLALGIVATPYVSQADTEDESQAVTPDADAGVRTPSLLDCARSILQQHGETILRPSAQSDQLLTWPHQVDREELARLAVITDTDQAQWLDGMYQIQITLVSDESGAPRLDVEARILGRQRTSLPLLRPSPWQRLDSSGVIEQEVNADLAACSNPADY
jgi:hypothetical protein